MPRAQVRPRREDSAEGSSAPDPSLAARWLRRESGGGLLRDRALESLKASRKDGAGGPEPRDLRGIRLAGEDLSGLDLSGVDLSGADLSGANLSGSRLVGTKLRGAAAAEADLSGCELLNADLAGADLTECVAERAGFGGADLSAAKLFHAKLSQASFTKSTLREADLRAAELQGARFLEADLTHADLSRANLQDADLEKSEIENTLFTEADLRRARVRGVSGFGSASWIGADILDVDFCGAYMMRRAISDENYLHEFRRQSRFHAGLYWVWWATSDCGRSFLRWGLWTIFLASVFAGLFQLVAIDYGDHPTFLSPLYYSVVTLTTLGYGDVVPASTAAQLMAMIEVTLGYVMLGGLLSIFSNKMARRAD